MRLVARRASASRPLSASTEYINAVGVRAQAHRLRVHQAKARKA